MKKITLILLLCIQIQWLSAQCNDGEIELWDNCYGIDITYELNLSGQGLSGGIPNTIAELSNLMFLDLSNNNLEGDYTPGNCFHGNTFRIQLKQ